MKPKTGKMAGLCPVRPARTVWAGKHKKAAAFGGAAAGGESQNLACIIPYYAY
jgi:hypothetical protein